MPLECWLLTFVSWLLLWLMLFSCGWLRLVDIACKMLFIVWLFFCFNDGFGCWVCITGFFDGLFALKLWLIRCVSGTSNWLVYFVFFGIVVFLVSFDLVSSWIQVCLMWVVYACFGFAAWFMFTLFCFVVLDLGGLGWWGTCYGWFWVY